MGTTVQVKWGKEKMEVEVDTDSEPLQFKSQLFALTGVQPERQKILYKGKTLGEDWSGFPSLDAGVVLMMMGSAAPLPAAPKEAVKFLEDMSEAELASVTDKPAGLKNLGNTCYLASTLQCLSTVPELRTALSAFRGSPLNLGADGGAEAITASVRDLYAQMDRTTQEVMPLLLVQVLHTVFPRFAEKDDHGHWMQQDASECWLEILRCFQAKISLAYLQGRIEVSIKCKETEEEEEVKTSEDFLHLSCFLSQEVKYLHSGLVGALGEEITKASPKLDRDAVYEKKSLISRLPAYLTVQLIRFFYKEKDKINAKILKDVKFPMELDVWDYCSPELRGKLEPMRERYKEAEDRKAQEAKKKGGDGGAAGDEKKEAEAMAPLEELAFADDAGSNNSGLYSLQAVLTHKGRSSNSGHYVGWVKRGSGQWLMCDDDRVVPVSEEDVLKLSGGGDWHSAYILLYGPRPLHLPSSAAATSEAAQPDAPPMDSS